MSKIEDMLNRTVREDRGIKRWVVVVGIAIALSTTMGSLLGILFLADVDGYLHDNKEIINLYDFYDQRVGVNETAVFFIGSSIVGNSIYPTEVNNIVKRSYPNVTAYNLAVSGDVPIERVLEIQKIIDAKPSLVIYGITYRSVTADIDYARFFERIKPVYSRIDIRNDSLFLYTLEEKKYFAPLNDIEKIRYLRSAVEYKCSGIHRSINYSYDPYGGEDLRKSMGNVPQIKMVSEANDPNCQWRPFVTNESTRYKDALIYIVKTLQDAGIPVIILNMPIYPLISEKMPDESKSNFCNLLDETGVVWYNFDCYLDEDCFRSTGHTNFDGALKFAPRMADIIIEQVEKDVIHYT